MGRFRTHCAAIITTHTRTIILSGDTSVGIRNCAAYFQTWSSGFKVLKTIGNAFQSAARKIERGSRETDLELESTRTARGYSTVALNPAKRCKMKKFFGKVCLYRIYGRSTQSVSVSFACKHTRERSCFVYSIHLIPYLTITNMHAYERFRYFNCILFIYIIYLCAFVPLYSRFTFGFHRSTRLIVTPWNYSYRERGSGHVFIWAQLLSRLMIMIMTSHDHIVAHDII